MPAKKKRAAKRPATRKPATKKRATRRPATKKRAAKKRATRKPATKKRAAKKRAVKKRAARRPAPKKRAKKKAAPKKRAVRRAAPKKRAKKKAAPKKRAKKKTARRAATKKRAGRKSPKKKVARSVVSSSSPPRIRRKTPKPKQKNNQSTQNIKRIDSEKTHGWQVHVCRNGVLRTKLFSDRVYGGKRVALTEAKHFRDHLRAEMTQNIAPTWQNRRPPKTNTGHLGVSYTEARRSSGDVKAYITATARVPRGRAVNRKFSVGKIGYDQALAQAVAWRKEQLNRREEIERRSAARLLRS